MLIGLVTLLLQSGPVDAHQNPPASRLDRNRCGAHSLQLCAETLGRRAGTEAIATLLPDDGRHASLAELQVAATALGLVAVAVRWDDQPPVFALSHSAAVIPVVTHDGRQHFVALLESRGDQVLVVDFPGPAQWVFASRLRDRFGWDGSALHLAVDEVYIEPMSFRWRWWPSALFASCSLLLLLAASNATRLWMPQILIRMKSARGDCVPAARGGVTLVEVLVVMAIVGSLMSVLLPAIQQAREAARRVQCKSHLRQISLALASYCDGQGRVPPSIEPLAQRGSRVPLFQRDLSIHAQLLPHLGEGTVFDRIVLSETGASKDEEPPGSPVNRELLRHPIAVFTCPTDPVPAGGTSYRVCAGTTTGSGVARVMGCRLRDISDGTSQTVFFSEKLIGDRDPTHYTPWRDEAQMPAPVPLAPPIPDEIVRAMSQACHTPASVLVRHRSYGGTAWLFSSYTHTTYNHVLGPNSLIADCEAVPDGSRAVSARSLHGGGVNVLMGDGAVRFVSESIELQLWRGLATINRNEVIGEF